MINKGSYVRIRTTLLKPNERSSNLPEETKKVPYKMWVKGYTQEESELFEFCEIKTLDGRIVKGRIKETNPAYKHNYGDFVEEAMELRKRIKGDFYE
jgi:hypothetical protein